MILSNPKIDYTSVRRIPNVKLSEQTPEPATTTTTNTMSTSTSLQDISAHHTQKFTWNDNNNDNNRKDQRLVNYYERLLSSNSSRQLNSSHSDERIFEHPEVTIKSSALDDEIQRRLLTIKTSNTNENFLESEGGKSIPNILEHPDMRSPVVMQPQQMSSSYSSSALLTQNNCKKINRTQSGKTYNLEIAKSFLTKNLHPFFTADVSTNVARTPSPNIPIEVFLDDQQDLSRSNSPGPLFGDIIESLEQEKNQDPHSSSSLAATDSLHEYSESSSKSNINTIETEKKDCW
ncbi:unnamed protein product [Rotaria sp. Silwood2]|nr:unnamed protein product [Rotaria sp. Silwood2]CAF2862101.1 unnamed protein product [Rotaria sp. Silwood2]CAF4041488.1 unnamed protein product [Rotaria sp. Silwood2]